MSSTYLVINLVSVLLPLIFTFHPKLRFDLTWKSFWPAVFISAFVFILWDIYFTSLGVWGFNPAYITGHYIFNLPVEEVLFFICIPYASVFTYHCLNELLQKDPMSKYMDKITFTLVIFLSATGIFFIGNLYTGTTFILLAIMLLFLKYGLKIKWLGRFYRMYSIILIPFLIVNGILTGSFIEEPVVWYNDTENLGIRLMTIPVEDVFYGMLLLLLNITLYEYFKSAKRTLN